MKTQVFAGVMMLLALRAEAKEDAKADADETPAAVTSKAGFGKGEAAFNDAKKSLLEAYYRKGLTEDELYRAATLGLMQYVDPSLRRWNTLLAPAEMKELQASLKGEIVGVGVALSFFEESGYGEVTSVLPGTAAEKAGIQRGDLIVSVNGKLYKGLTIDALVADIRGKAGESVKMTALRGDKLLPFTMKRAAVTFEQVSWRTLPFGEGKAGLIRVRSFSEKTPALVDKAFAELEAAKVGAIIVDLRDNHGGSFEDAIAVSERFVAAGQTIVRVQTRTGETTRVSKGTPLLADVPIGVLVGNETASGAELFAAALRDARGAMVVGKRTFGKGTLQRVDELDNGYGIKFTIGLFSTPNGKAIQSDGIVPDVEVDGDEVAIHRASGDEDVKKVIAGDPALRTTLSLLGGKKR